jgi:prephenate dehydratase
MTRVAIQGVSGSYSEEAARRILGEGAAILECSDFPSTFRALHNGSADHAVVPVENKIVGEIAQTVELLNSNGYKILKKLSLKVQHVLAAAPGARFDDLISVRSHVEALKQCRNFLAANPRLMQMVGSDTASSIRRVTNEKDLTRGAIGSRRAAEIHGAEILRENIADDIDNWTIFYLIGN